MLWILLIHLSQLISDRFVIVFSLALLHPYLIFQIAIIIALFLHLLFFFQNAFYLVPCFGDYGRKETTHLTTTELLSQELQPVTSISTYKQTMVSGAVTSGLNQCSL